MTDKDFEREDNLDDQREMDNLESDNEMTSQNEQSGDTDAPHPADSESDSAPDQWIVVYDDDNPDAPSLKDILSVSSGQPNEAEETPSAEPEHNETEAAEESEATEPDSHEESEPDEETVGDGEPDQKKWIVVYDEDDSSEADTPVAEAEEPAVEAEPIEEPAAEEETAEEAAEEVAEELAEAEPVEQEHEIKIPEIPAEEEEHEIKIPAPPQGDEEDESEEEPEVKKRKPGEGFEFDEDYDEDDEDDDLEEEVEKEEEERFEIAFDENGEIQVRTVPKSQKSEPLTRQERWQQSRFAKYEVHEEEEAVDPDDLVIYDEIVAAIKAEGAKLRKSEFLIRQYNKNCHRAIKHLKKALKIGVNALDTNRDDREMPVILAGVIRIYGKILEIRCNNLENLVRVKAHDHVKPSRKELHRAIDEYNDYVIAYSSLTGEQLTRMSTFLPENIAAGKVLSVVPTLSYKEGYVQYTPDGEISRDEAVTLTVIKPRYTATDALSGNHHPRTKIGCALYTLRIKWVMRRLRFRLAKLTKQILRTNSAKKRYESELYSLESRTPLAERASREYKNKVFTINVKYGKQLSGIETVKTATAFHRARVRMHVDRLSVERERLYAACDLLGKMNRSGTRSQRKFAKKAVEAAIKSYNSCADATSRVTGTHFDHYPITIIERICRGEEITFPLVAYKRELIETVGEESRLISMALSHEIAPDEQGYADNSAKILSGKSSYGDISSLSEDMVIVDRASAIAKIMLASLQETADTVVNADDLDRFKVKAEKATTYFKRAKRVTERAISTAFDEHGVVTALVENLRVISNLIEVRRIKVAVLARMGRKSAASSEGDKLYRDIELYNGRAIDYMSIVGEQFTRITSAIATELIRDADKLKIPKVTYKDNYIEVFPKDPLKDTTYEKPRLWRSGVYTPLLMHHYRLTENRAVETTVVNSPFVFDVTVDEMPAVSWWHPIGFFEHLFMWTQPIIAWWNRMLTNAEIWLVDESLAFSKDRNKGRQGRSARRKKRYEKKLKKLNNKHQAKILELETVVHDSDRHGIGYQKKLSYINNKYQRKIYNLNVRYMKDCPGRNATRLLLERLVIERERLSGINKLLIKYRNYGRLTLLPNVITRYKAKFIKAINDHNATARKLSELVGINFAEVSTTVADEIIRYGKLIKFPQIICCREVIENIDDKQRTVGDRWHGYGLYTGASGSAAASNNPPVMSVGAMGYATDMGVPFLKADFDGMTLLGMTPGGVPLIGFTDNGETAIPFTGTPMMLSGEDGGMVLYAGQQGQGSLILGAANVTDPYSGINSRAVDPDYVDDAEEEAKDIKCGCTVETPVDLQTKLIEERFSRSLRARSMTVVDGIGTWWRLVGSEWNLRIMRHILIRHPNAFGFLLPWIKDRFAEPINDRLTKEDQQTLRYISKLGLIIDIECKRFYSAVKAGIRRSQRVFSCWLHDDIERYNDLAREFNSRHERYMHIELLSLTIPDRIKHRKDDRPPTPPVLSLRNKIKLDDESQPITTENLYDKLYEYSISAATKHRGPIGELWAKMITIPRIQRANKRGKHAKVIARITKVVRNRMRRTYVKRQKNEDRYYHIRYEKARAMRKYNNRNMRAVGVAINPIKYQKKAHGSLRKYLMINFRIDYNMRIYQLIPRSMRVNPMFYTLISAVMITVLAVAYIFFPPTPSTDELLKWTTIWISLPAVLASLQCIYMLCYLIVALISGLTRNAWLPLYGARDVERNRYGITLDCFVSEQYTLLLACEKLRQKPNSNGARKHLVKAVNEYNNRVEYYSNILRIPIREVETTGLIDKLVSGEKARLTELQNFVYVRELVERTDLHNVGKKLPQRELGDMVAEINQIINGINVNGSDNEVAVDFLQGAMQRLIGYLQTDIRPTQNERFELKRDLITAIDQFEISRDKKELFASHVIKIVDQLGGRDRRKIIAVLAKDDMVM